MTNFSSEIIVWAFWKSPGNCFYLFPSMSKTRWKLGDFLKVKISRISNLSKHRLAYTHFKGLDELMKMQPIIFQNIHNYAKLCIIMQNMQVFYFYQNIALCILILKHSLSWLLCPNTVTERGAVNNPCGFVPDIYIYIYQLQNRKGCKVWPPFRYITKLIYIFWKCVKTCYIMHFRTPKHILNSL